MIPGNDEVMNGKRRNLRTSRPKKRPRDPRMSEQKKKEKKHEENEYVGGETCQIWQKKPLTHGETFQ